jgi:hypothetical protein
MSITLSYAGNSNNFKDACKRANAILQSDRFYEMIAAREKPFEESVPKDLQPKIIAALFKNTHLNLTLREYTRPASIGGAFDPDYPTVIWVNVNTNRSGCTYAAVLVHECVHALSFHSKEYNFSHDGDDPSLNQNTAPYAIQRATRQTFCEEMMESVDDLIQVELKVEEKDIVPVYESSSNA